MKSNLSPVLQRVWANIHHEQRNWICLICGKTGTGKSLSAISLALKLDPEFAIDRVAFDADSFMKLVKTKLPRGSFIVADEIGSWMSNREYQSTSNKCLSYVLQTFRYKQLGVIWTTPIGKFVDVNLRTMCDAVIETLKVNRKEQVVITKFKYVQTNPLTGEVRYPYPVISREGQSSFTVFRYEIPRPPAKIERQYKRRKISSLEPKYEEWHSKMKDEEVKKVRSEPQQPNAICKKCGYAWYYSGKLKPRCPRCSSSVVDVTP